MSDPLAHAVARLLMRLPLIFNVILVIWIESAILGIASFLTAVMSFPEFSLMAFGLFGIGTAVLNYWLIALTRDFTVDFYMSRDWKRSNRAMLRKREDNDPERPDFTSLKRFCRITLSCNLLIAALVIAFIWWGFVKSEFGHAGAALRHSFIVIVLLLPVVFYIGWTWYAMRFIFKYEPPRRSHFPPY